jgi:hypothetical protein
VHVVVFDDLAADFQRVRRALCAFLDIDPELGVIPPLARPERAAGARPRSAALARLLWRPRGAAAARSAMPKPLRRALRRRLGRWNEAPPPPMDPETRPRLLADCAPDVHKLSEILGRDLSGWLHTEQPSSAGARTLESE